MRPLHWLVALMVLPLLALAACSVQTPFPADWTAAAVSATAPCAPLTGRYDNDGEWAVGDDLDRRSLAMLFFPLQRSEIIAAHIERRAATSLSFEPAGADATRVRAWVQDELLFERVLSADDLGCHDGQLLYRETEWIHDASIVTVGRVSSRYRITPAGDGSLLMSQHDGGAGVALGFVPVIALARSWLRFMPAGELPPHPPRGVRAAPATVQRLQPPQGAKKWTAYEQANTCSAFAQENADRPLSPSARGRLGGRTTHAFLTGGLGSISGPPGESDRRMGWVPAAHRFRVEKLHWEPDALTDHYVLCLLDLGYQFEP